MGRIKSVKLAVLVPILLALMLMPASVFAHTDFPYWGPIVHCGSIYPPGPCISFCELVHTGQNFIQLLLTVAVFVALPLSILFGGFLIMTAGGSTERVGRGKKVITGVLTGLALTIGSYLIVSTVLFALGALTSDATGPTKVGWPTVSCS